MTKKRTTGAKSPKETGTWYKSLIEGKSKAEYYRHFIKKLNDIITQYFGADEAMRTLKAVESQKLQVAGIESFLFDFNNISDLSLELYNTCKSLDEFVTKSIVNFKKRGETGETNILIKTFFLVMADLSRSRDKYTQLQVQEILRKFITSLITVRDKSPYLFAVIEPQWAAQIGKQLGLNTSGYETLFINTLSVFEEIMEQLKDTRAYLPALQILYPVYYDVRDNQLSYITSHLRLVTTPNKARNTLKDIPDLSQDTPQLRSGLEYLRSYAKLPFMDIQPIIYKLQELGESRYLKRYANKYILAKAFPHTTKNYYNTFNITPVFAYKELFEQCMVPYFCDVQIDCSKIKKENLESFIDAAKTINLTKGYYNQKKRDINNLTFKITLLNVKDVTEDFMDFVRNKLRRINSSTNKNFIMEVFFDSDIVVQKIPDDITTHFRVISDIHSDYNAEHGYHFHFGNDFILNCGDTAGNSLAAGRWVANYMKRGAIIIGNHLAYSSSHPERDGIQNMERYSHTRHPSSTKREQIKELYNLLDQNSVTLLSNSCTSYKGIAIIGTCLYTDFKLYGDEHKEECMAYAKKYMNDFRLPVVMDNVYYTQDRHGTWWPNRHKMSESCIRPFDVSDHAFYFQYSFEYIKKAVEENKHKPIIIMTHHAPSPYSIDEKYKGDLLNAAFASNLNQYILEHPEIRLWVHGHCVDDQTEILTTKGWKYFNQIKETDKILNLNPINNKIEEDQINAIISKFYTGSVYHFHSKGSDIRVTEDHDMLTIYRKTKKLTKIKAKDLYDKKQKFIIRAGIQDKGGIDLTDDLLRLLVWISADGNRPSESSNLVRFRLFKERKIKRLQELLNSLNIQYRIYCYDNSEGCSINFDLPSELQKLSFKPIDPIISQCNKHQCSVILEEYANTDGVHNGNTIIIYTSKKEEADTIQLMCITNGYGCSISERVNHGFKLQSGERKISYELNIVNNPYRCIDNPHRTTTIEHVTNEHFWCLNTNNGTLIIRRNGKVNITGNCHTPVDYILGETRVVCCPFGYNNENNFNLPYEYGLRIPIEEIKSKKSWKRILETDIKSGKVKVYEG